MALAIPAWLANAGVNRVIESANYTRAKGRHIRLIVLHYAVTGETSTAAEGVANYFARSTTQASSHFTTDNDSTVYQVDLDDVAWAAPGANHDGIQIEQAGTTQTREEWLDPYGQAMLDRTARLVVALGDHYGIPLRRLTDEQLAAGGSGIIDHWAATRVYKRSDHTDLGTGFPWDHFMGRVAHFAGNQQEEDIMASLEDLEKLLDKKLTVSLTDFQMEAIGTQDREWELAKAAGYTAGQAALARRRTGQLLNVEPSEIDLDRLADKIAGRVPTADKEAVKAAFQEWLDETTDSGNGQP